jgi:hypothetical protein
MGTACSTHRGKMNAYRFFYGKVRRKGPLGRPSRRWENNIKMDYRRIG